MFFSRQKNIATHDGNFHTDDVFAVASLSLFLNGKIKVIRTRDPKKISKADYVVDVGSVYDETKNRFDHHQSGAQTNTDLTQTGAELGAGRHPNGISYAAFGLVWKKFGAKICGEDKVAALMEKKLVEPIDAYDNGEGDSREILPGIFPYTINDIIDALNPTHDEIRTDGKIVDGAFFKATKFAKELLAREIVLTKARFEAEEVLKQNYLAAEDKRIVIVERHVPIEEYFSSYSEPLFTVYQYSDGDWAVRTVRKDCRIFESRKLFPESWAGKRDVELADVTGVSDAVFCHNKRFLAIAKSKEGALKLAEIALESKV